MEVQVEAPSGLLALNLTMLVSLFALISLSAPSDLQGPAGAGIATSIHWVDLDRDGYQDAVALDGGGLLRLLRNDGGVLFVDATAEAGLEAFTGVRALLVGDADGDRDADLILAGAGSLILAENERGVFRGRPVLEAGVAPAVTELAWIDADGDARPDLHLETATEHLVLLNRVEGFVPMELGLEGAGVRPVPRTSLAGRAVDQRPSVTGKTVVVGTEPTALDSGDSGDELVTPEGGGRVLVPSGTSKSSAELLCATSVRDLATGACVAVSSEPTLGMLYPVSTELYIESGTGRVGIGTTTPGYALEVAGQIVSGVGNTPTGANSAIGGGSSNNANSPHATVAGGSSNQALGEYASVGGGFSNLAASQRATIGGGVGNSAANSATVGGGETNSADLGFSTVAGGRFNTAGGGYSAVGGGGNNQANGDHAVVGGGGDGANALNGNVAGGDYSTIAGGRGNSASDEGATVGGGEGNSVTRMFGTVAGGDSNLVTAPWGTVPGGRDNEAAGTYSLAAGRRARAVHGGSFVWGDATDADITSTGSNQFVVRASGGMGVGKTPDSSYQLDVEGAFRASDTIVSTKLSGAPLQVASADVVPNLNADRLDGFDAAAFSTFGTEVNTGELANDAVTSGKILDGEVSGLDLAPGAVGTSQLAVDAVSTSRIQDAAVTLPKIDPAGGVAGQVLSHDGAGATWSTVPDASWTPIDSLPFVASAPGAYYLADDLLGTGDPFGIEVTADDVLIDLNGHVLEGVPGTVAIAGVTDNTTVRGGTITGWDRAILVEDGAAVIDVTTRGNGVGLQLGEGVLVSGYRSVDDGIGVVINSGNVVNATIQDPAQYGVTLARGVVENTVVLGAGTRGIQVSVGDDVLLEDCTVIDSGTEGFYCRGTLLVNCTAKGSGTFGFDLNDARATGCSARGVTGGGYLLEAATVSECSAVMSSTNDAFQVGSDCQVLNCSGATIGTGFQVAGDRNRIDGNTSQAGGFGFNVLGNDNLVIRNWTGGGPTTAYSISAGNHDAAVLSPGTAFSSTNAWANFEM